MCGRIANTMPSDAMASLFRASPANDLPPVPNFNICPTDPVHAVIAGRQLVSMRWGFLPHWYKAPGGGPLLIHARAETIAEKPAYREACRTRRCLLPATGFYEWTKDEAGNRLPWYIARGDGQPVMLAGIWQVWERDGDRHVTCAVVTTSANRRLAPLHHRMPVTVEQDDWALWLGEAGKGAALLMRPAADEVFTAHRVAPRVNSNRAAGPELIEPVDA